MTAESDTLDLLLQRAPLDLPCCWSFPSGVCHTQPALDLGSRGPVFLQGQLFWSVTFGWGSSRYRLAGAVCGAG